MTDKERRAWVELQKWIAKDYLNCDVSRAIGDLLDEQPADPPYRGGWFMAETPYYHAKTRRWRDPKTGKVWRDDDMNQACASFEDYTNIQWEDDEPAKTGEPFKGIDQAFDEPERPWPPKGLLVLVQWEERYRWLYAESNGRGEFRISPSDEWEEAYAWRYLPANWENAPVWAKQWVITSFGAQFWSGVKIRVGDALAEGGCAVHVESRL